MKKWISCLFAGALFFAPGWSVAQTSQTPAALAGITEMTPPYLELNPGPHYWPRVRIWQGIPTVARAPGGRLWAAWYTGLLGEGKGLNYVPLVTSEDDGKTWSKPVVVYDPSRNFLGADTGDPCLFVDPNGRLWLFVNRSMKVPSNIGLTTWGFYTENPDSPKPTWKGPVFAGYGGGLNKPFVLPDGTWFAMIDCRRPDKTGKPELAKGAHLYKFMGYDKPFESWGSVLVKDSIFAEHMVIERKDKSLWMLLRTTWGIAQAESRDGGKTWTDLGPFTKDFSVSTRFFLEKLASGNLLLIVNDTPRGRSKMTAMLSEDEGKTWPYKLMLDERDSVSYPDGFQTKDGAIYVTYDRGRYSKDMQEILLAKFTEADVKAGKVVSPGSYLRQTINKLADEGGGVRFDGETQQIRDEYVRLNPDSVEAKKAAKAEEGEKTELNKQKAAK